MAQEYAILDKAATASESYLKGRLKTIDEQLEDIQRMSEEKDKENEILKQEIKELEAQLEKERDTNKAAVLLELEENQPSRMRRIMRRNQVIQKIKEQQAKETKPGQDKNKKKNLTFNQLLTKFGYIQDDGFSKKERVRPWHV